MTKYWRIKELFQAYKKILNRYNATPDEWEHFNLLIKDIEIFPTYVEKENGMWVKYEDISHLPTTADGYPLYPGMPIYVCVPFSTNKYYTDIIHSFEKDKSGECFVILEGSRFFNEYCRLWEEGNTEHTSRIFFEKEKCLQECENKLQPTLNK